MTNTTYINDLKRIVLDSKGNISTSKLRYMPDEMKTDIIEKTSFLGNDATLGHRINCLFKNITEIPLCLSCNKTPTKWNKVRREYSDYCSNECISKSDHIKKLKSEKFNKRTKQEQDLINIKRKKTCLEKYGVEVTSQIPETRIQAKETCLEKYGNENFRNTDKAKETCLEKYGVEFTTQTDTMKLKSKETCLEKYGVDSYSMTDDFKDKVKNTCLSKYGVEYYLQSDDKKEKSKKTSQLKYGVEYYLQSDKAKTEKRISARNKYSDDILKMFDTPILFKSKLETAGSVPNLAKDLNIGKHKLFRLAKEYNIDVPTENHISSQHKEIIDYIESISETEIVINTRSIISPLELDIYLPEYKLAIEIDGVYWHSEQQGKDRNYHLNKTELCLEQGIKLLHIFETDNIEIWKSTISGILQNNTRVFARKCIIQELDNLSYKEFCTENHLQGHSAAKYKYGLYYKDNLVAIMSFAKSRYSNSYDFELMRYCNKRHITVVGGASKLLSYFMKHNKGDIVSYANRRWSEGDMYKTIGFDELNDSTPNYFYIVRNKLESRLKYQKHKLSNILENFDINLSEYDNMISNGFDRIWDCGNKVFVLYNKI